LKASAGMGEKSHRNSLKPPEKCIFCGGGNLSKEHFWPEWASVLLPRYPDNRRIEQVFTTENARLVKPPEVRARQGHSWTKTIRAVCRRCNNGWMSVLEKAAKPILTPLITSRSHALTEDSMRVLAQWIALKVMVGERNHPKDAVTPLGDRTRFRATLALPSHLRIWVAQCGTQGWDTGYLRHAATMATSPVVMPHHRFKNIHSVAFGIGDLFVFVIHTTVAGVEDALTFNQPEGVIPVFPVVGPANWPPPKRLCGSEASAVADTLNRLFRCPRVRWVPGFP
jgi:hypothetical protein